MQNLLHGVEKVESKRCDYCGNSIRKAKKPIRYIYSWNNSYAIDWYCSKKCYDISQKIFGITTNPVLLTKENYYLLEKIR